VTSLLLVVEVIVGKIGDGATERRRCVVSDGSWRGFKVRS
jgi:hypothetical protein